MSAAPNYVIFDEKKEAIEIPTAPDLLLQWEPRCNGLRSCIRTALGRMPRMVGDPGKLYIEWEPIWRGFRAAVRPALSRSERPLEGECPLGVSSRRSAMWSALLHGIAFVVLLLVSANMIRSARLKAVAPEQPTSPYEVIYYSGEELPQMKDAGGAAEGKVGKSGGRELYHPTQVIRIARGNKLVDTVADAPDLKLPRTTQPVANLLSAPAADPGPPPLAAVNSIHPAAGLMAPPTAVPAPPQVKRDKLMSAPDLIAGAVQAPPDAMRQVAGARPPELGTAQVVPPPVSAPAQTSAAIPKISLPTSVAVAPPPQVASKINASGITGFGAPRDVVPPAPVVGGQALSGSGIPGGFGTGTADAVAPPPQVGAGGKADGGMINGAMKALGSMMGSISGSGPPGGSSAVVVSANPGTGVGMPGSGGPGSLAMSPNGGKEPGLGGSGGGAGIGYGTGTGTGIAGDGTGSGKSGDGLANGPAKGGTSLSPGPGGSGNGNGRGGVPGVTVSGGTAKVNLPSFSTPSSSGAPIRGSTDKRNPPAITVIASARSGGAINAYGAFKGAKVYTIYLDTRLGLAVLQYAEKAGAPGSFEADLDPPEAITHDLPADLPKRKLLISCTMDKSGTLKNLRVVEGGGATVSAKLLPALEHWRFRPAFKGDEPVEVDAILGFDVDTR